MAKYKVTTDQGVFDVTTEELSQEQPQEEASPFKSALESVISAPSGIVPYLTEPKKMFQAAGPALPVVGGILGGGAGAAGGELARQVIGTAIAPETVPKTWWGRALATTTAGVAQEPAMLKTVPGVPQAVNYAKRAGTQVGQGLAKLAEAASGVPARDIKQLFKKPGTLFKLGSREKAGEAIGAAKLKAGVNPGITENISTFNPENVSKAVDVAGTGQDALMSVANKTISGERLTSEEVGDALKFVGNKIKEGLSKGSDVSELINTQNHLNSILGTIAPEVQEARQAFAPLAQRDKFLSLFPRNKSGSFSKANLFYLNSLLGGVGYATGGARGAGSAVLAGIIGRAPITTGLITSIAGGMAKASTKVMGNPTAREALISSYIHGKQGFTSGQ